MAPKTKKAASKDAPAAKKTKASKKSVSGGENGAAKLPGRQSKRNVDKVVVYKEVGEKVDEKASENQPRKVPMGKVKRKSKKAKRTHGSDSEESESSDEEDEDFAPKVKASPKAKSPEKKKKSPKKKAKEEPSADA